MAEKPTYEELKHRGQELETDYSQPEDLPEFLNKFIKNNVFSASLRIVVPLYITYALFVLIAFAVFLPSLENHLMEQKNR